MDQSDQWECRRDHQSPDVDQKASAVASLYQKGFTNSLFVESSPWTNLGPKTTALSLTNLTVSVSGQFVGGTLDFTNMDLATNNTFQGVNSPNVLIGSITNKTGRLIVTFISGNSTSSTAVGAVLQDTGAGGGFFTNVAGSFILTPSP